MSQLETFQLARPSMLIVENLNPTEQLEEYERMLDRSLLRRQTAASEERFRLIIETIPQGIWRTNPDGSADYFSERFYKLVGYTQDEILGWGWSHIIHPDDRSRVLEEWRKCRDSKSPISVDFRVRQKGGDYRWFLSLGKPFFDDQGELYKYYGTWTDIHDENSMKEALIEREEKIQFALRAAQMGAYEINLRLGQLILSAKAEEIFGHPDLEIDLIQAAKKSVHPEDFQKMLDKKYYAIQEKIPFSDEFRVVKKDGTVGWVLSQGEARYDRNGNPVSFYGVVQDITNRKHAEEELKRSKDFAERANLLKTTFLTNMSHEIRTPMAAVLGFSEVLRMPDLTSQDRKDALDRIDISGRALLKLIDDILDVSKVESGKLITESSKFSPLEIVTEVSLLLKLQAEQKGLEVKTVFHPAVPATAFSDSSRLRQILINLVGNAIKFTRSGRVVTEVRTEIDSSTNKSFLVFEVHDTGIGISPSDQSKIFQPFAQADGSITRQFGGTGLGLLLSKRLAQQLGGDLILKESRVGLGSRFLFKIEAGPFSDELWEDVENRTPTVAENETFLSTDLLNQARILVVDDVVDNQLLMRKYLESAGAVVEVASDGAEGINKAAFRYYDVVLMDIQMPILDGIQATKKLRSLGYQKPILALTAHAMRDETERSLQAGCNEHLTKPISRQLLVTAVSRHYKKSAY